MNLSIIGIARDRSGDKGDKAKVSKKYAELYDSPRRSVQYADLPQHEVNLAMGPEPTAFVASPAVAELSVPAPSILHADSLSLYGYDPNTRQALGLPIADAYLGAHYSASFTFLAVADGCGWGNGPAKAAQVAVRALHEQVTRKLSNPAKRTSHDVAHYLLAALTKANEQILQSGSDPADPVTAGTTTVLAGVVCKLVNTSGKCPPYAFVGISLGDCKAYRVSRRTGQVRDVLKGGPRGENATDPGGRLGPADYQRPVVPDLRNLQLVFAYLEPGDAVVLMSDGVHDNLDPVFLGEWDERNGKGKAWPLKELEAKKEEKAQAIVNGLPHLERSAQDLTRVFLRHCTATVQPTIDFMAANKGGGRLKQDFKTLPGKQDHATVLAYNVPLGDAAGEPFVPPVSPLPSPRSHMTASDSAAIQRPSGSLGGPDSARPSLPLSLSLPAVASSGSPRLSPAQSPRGPPLSPSGLKPGSRDRP